MGEGVQGTTCTRANGEEKDQVRLGLGGGGEGSAQSAHAPERQWGKGRARAQLTNEVRCHGTSERGGCWSELSDTIKSGIYAEGDCVNINLFPRNVRCV